MRSTARARPASRRRRCSQWFARARVAPVLTAHPTEVQRQSILDCEREIARLLSQSGSRSEKKLLHAEILRLWLTAMLRGTRLAVSDEVANGLAYFRLTFLNQLPRLYAELEHALKERFDLDAEPRLPPFLTVGTWIGGDRDGNPYVTAAVMRGALAQQARLVLAHYLEEVGQLYKELALSARIRPAPPGDRGARRGVGRELGLPARRAVPPRDLGHLRAARRRRARRWPS